MIVSNTSPLIALAAIKQLELLRLLFERIVIPPAVRAEVQNAPARAALEAADWIIIQPPRDVFAVRLLGETLDAGESEAIVLAQELGADWLLLDEHVARRKAASAGLHVVGTLGLLLMGKQAGHLPALKPWLELLQQTDFRADAELYAQMLALAGEV
jgi:predicted nucleic acid-binding protein